MTSSNPAVLSTHPCVSAVHAPLSALSTRIVLNTGSIAPSNQTWTRSGVTVRLPHPRIRVIGKGMGPRGGETPAESRAARTHAEGRLGGPRTPWNGVHVKICGQMSSR